MRRCYATVLLKFLTIAKIDGEETSELFAMRNVRPIQAGIRDPSFTEAKWYDWHMKKPVIFTIGHSTHPIDEFIELLKAHGIQEIVDVRSIPKSRHNPQFNSDRLKQSLQRVPIRYKLLKKLGGLRHTKKDSINLGWHNTSFRGYADYMATLGFAEGLEALTKIANVRNTAIMCAEAVPWRCHRSLIADALSKQGWFVRDIMSRTSATKHRLTPFLKVRKGQLIYPAPKT